MAKKFIIQEHRLFKKAVADLDKKVTPKHKEILEQGIENLKRDPSQGERLKGNFSGFRAKKLSFKDQKPEYRLIFQFIEGDAEDVLHLVVLANREFFNNFYNLKIKQLKKYFL